MDEACLFDDMAEVERKLGQGIQVAGSSQCTVAGAALDDDEAGECITTATVLGYHSQLPPVYSAGVYLTSDDLQLKLAALSDTCEVRPLLVHSAESDPGEHREEDHLQVDRSSLYSIITSTGFMLD